MEENKNLDSVRDEQFSSDTNGSENTNNIPQKEDEQTEKAHTNDNPESGADTDDPKEPLTDSSESSSEPREKEESEKTDSDKPEETSQDSDAGESDDEEISTSALTTDFDNSGAKELQTEDGSDSVIEKTDPELKSDTDDSKEPLAASSTSSSETGGKDENGKSDSDKPEETSQDSNAGESDDEEISTSALTNDLNNSDAKEPQTEDGSDSDIEKTAPELKSDPVVPEIAKTSEDNPVSNEAAKEETPADEQANKASIRQKPDYSTLSKEELIKEFAILLESDDITSLRDDIENLRSNYEKASADELRSLKKKFLDEGGLSEDFKPQEDPNDFRFKDLLQEYRNKKTAYFKKLETEKETNLEEKFKIIEEIKDLINRKESLNKTFNEFNELQRRWRDAGLVPQAKVKELWETYHHHVEKFYDYIKINKELRDLDFKKNLEAKTQLCEKAEELLLEANIIEAFRTLQGYHDLWREIGPVPPETRSDIWERFKEATSKINKKHQEHFENLKDQQKNNLEQKTILCEKAEEIVAQENKSFRDWDKRAQELKELQRVWKTIGFAPRKDNTTIYERFRQACDAFFTQKRDFFAQHREEQQNNLQLKTDLCIQAEALKDSTDWKKTTGELINLQKRWKEIGPVPRKYSDSVWKRFRAACDTFFNNKSEYFSNIDSKFEDNLKEKEALIKEINAYEIEEDAQVALKKLKDFQSRWAEIGFVPIKQKDQIQQDYRAAINDKFDHLKIDERKKNIIKYKSKLEDLSQNPKANSRMRQDREKYVNKLKQLENDIILWENNIGFFSNSKNAEKMIQEVENKIANARKNIELLKQKISLLEDKMEDFE